MRAASPLRRESPPSPLPQSSKTAALRPVEAPRLCAFVYVLAVIAVLGGFQCGYNTGIISSAMLHVVNNRHMRPVSHLWQEAIVAAMPVFAAMGALFAGRLGDTFGRRRLIMASTTVFGLGAAVCASAFDKPVLLLGRVLLGIALGISSMIVPIYVGECSPTHVRGQMLSAFNMCLCFGQMAANAVAGGLSYVDADNMGWRLMFGFATLPAIVQLIGFLFLPESPRWLFANVGGEKPCRTVLNKIYGRNKPWIDFELAEISAVIEKEMASRAKSGGDQLALTMAYYLATGRGVFATVWRTPHVRRALIIGTTGMIFNQLSGIDVLMYYTAPLIKSSGIHDNHAVVWLSLCTSFINFIGTLLPLIAIERFGRRGVLLASTALTSFGLLMLGTAFLLVNLDTMPSVQPEQMRELAGWNSIHDVNTPNLEHCLAKTNCDFCVTDDRCGFCTLPSVAVGLCLPLHAHKRGASATGYCSLPANLTDSDNAAAAAAAATAQLAAALQPVAFGADVFEWADVNCHTKYTIVPLALMVVYLLFFSIGLSTIPWVLNAEFYPLWARSTCGSIGTCALWTANAIVSLTFLSMASTVSRFGTFYMYAVITAFATYIFWRYVPDTSGYSLDEIEFLFMSPKQREWNLAEMHAKLSVSEAHYRASQTEIEDEDEEDDEDAYSKRSLSAAASQPKTEATKEQLSAL